MRGAALASKLIVNPARLAGEMRNEHKERDVLTMIELRPPFDNCQSCNQDRPIAATLYNDGDEGNNPNQPMGYAIARTGWRMGHYCYLCIEQMGAVFTERAARRPE